LEKTKRLGKKGGLGFYEYDDGKAGDVDESIYAELGAPQSERNLAKSEIQHRCVCVMINEAARILEDGIVATPGDVDVGMIFGTGFPPFRGGLLKYADSMGLARIVEMLQRYERELGPRFKVAPLLAQKASSNQTFY
jgi:3-hydroxyacyl-CoA dehydrogenase/enoyl-CoA hydratase/3-hydroxybutyryl-CoA epimerase